VQFHAEFARRVDVVGIDLDFVGQRRARAGRGKGQRNGEDKGGQSNISG
jgi:hypothetical protein